MTSSVAFFSYCYLSSAYASAQIYIHYFPSQLRRLRLTRYVWPRERLSGVTLPDSRVQKLDLRDRLTDHAWAGLIALSRWFSPSIFAATNLGNHFLSAMLPLFGRDLEESSCVLC